MSLIRSRGVELIKSLPPKSLLLLESAKKTHRNGDVEYPYRQASNSLYLSNFAEPEAFFGFQYDKGLINYLACKPFDVKLAAWIGDWVTPEIAKQQFDFDYVMSNKDWPEYLASLVKDIDYIWLDFNNCEQTKNILVKLRANIFSLQDISSYIEKQRMVKDKLEIDYLKKAVDVSVDAHIHIMQNCKHYSNEAYIEAEFFSCGRKNGLQSLAYPIIAAAGYRSCILHYNTNNQVINNNDLVLLDAGFEYNGYAADITRTIPSSGKFTSRQKALYELVLYAQETAISMVKPNVNWETLENKVRKILLSGCKDLKVFSDQASSLTDKELISIVFPHGLGHHLGLDVHDTCPQGRYNHDLQSGNVITIEPGLYFNEKNNFISQKWRGIGIRIEDDILVTDSSYKNLSCSLPKSVQDIESMMA